MTTLHPPENYPYFHSVIKQWEKDKVDDQATAGCAVLCHTALSAGKALNIIIFLLTHCMIITIFNLLSTPRY